MPLTGDFKGLEQLERNLRKLAEVPSQASKEAADGITIELQKEYTTGSDPYGKPWAPLKPSTLRRGRRPPPLTATGKMRDGTKAKPMAGGGVQLEVGRPQGVFHQYGTRIMAARRILPQKALPKAWGQILREAASNAINKVFKR